MRADASILRDSRAGVEPIGIAALQLLPSSDGDDSALDVTVGVGGGGVTSPPPGGFRWG